MHFRVPRFDRVPHYIPKRYRDSDKYSPTYLKLALMMPVLMIIGMMLIPFLGMEVRAFYSEVYASSYELYQTGGPITIQFATKTEEPLYYYITRIDENTQMIQFVNAEDNITEKATEVLSTQIDKTYYADITFTAESSDKYLVLQQRNGLKQLIMENGKQTHRWEPASDMSKLTFFAQNYPLWFVAFIGVCVLLLAILILLLYLISKKPIKSKSDLFTEELE